MTTYVDLGTGTPVVLVPAIQGRWEFARPAVDALAKLGRVLTFSLRGEPGTGTYDPTRGFDNYVSQIDEVLDASHLTRAVLVGVSAGGRIALRYAAERPERVTALVLVSAVPPVWSLKRIHELYAKYPTASAVAFLAGSPRRLTPEILRAFGGWARGLAFGLWYLYTALRARPWPRRMARLAQLMASTNQLADCARVAAPTLVITGEPDLDKVIPVEQTADYIRLIPGARLAVLPDTGHIGLSTRPEAFAALIHTFIADSVRGAEPACEAQEVA